MGKHPFVLISILFGMLLSSPSAWASRATTIVLGSGDGGIGVISGLGSVGGNGSFFYDDPYNIFYNPSEVNNYRSWVTVEKSNGPTGFTTAQGGFILNVLNFNIGAYVNRFQELTGVSNPVPGSALGSPLNYGVTSTAPQRPIELFIGSDMGVKWGVSLANASNLQAGVSSDDWAVSVGAQVSILEPFATVHFGPADSNGTTHFSVRGGTRVKFGEWIPYFVAYDAVSAGATFTDRELTLGGGLGRSTKVAEAVRIMGALSAWNQSITAGGIGTYNRTVVPLEIGAEGDVTVWLSLRAGLSYKVFDRTAAPGSSAYTNIDSTSGRIGASIHVSKADFDWAVGNNGGLGQVESPTAVNSQVFDFTSGFFTAAALTYRW